MLEQGDGPVPVLNGIDVLELGDFRSLGDRRVALVADRTSRTIDGRATADVLAGADGVFLDRIFALDSHPDSSAADDDLIAHETDDTVARIHLGPDSRICADRLADLDALIVDVQDVGCRLGPHIALIADALSACAEAAVRLWVFDRPNPLDGLTVEGPSCERSDDSEFARYALPLRHGMTLGEIARLIQQGDEIDVPLEVVGMLGWQRQYWFEHCGQTWFAPMAGLEDRESVALFCGLALLADTNVSLGLGAGMPYRGVWSPWIDGANLAKAISERGQEGISVSALSGGVRFSVDDAQLVAPPYVALAVIESLRELYPTEWDFRKLAARLARPDLLDAIEDKASELDRLWSPDPDFFEARAQVLLY